MMARLLRLFSWSPLITKIGIMTQAQSVAAPRAFHLQIRIVLYMHDMSSYGDLPPTTLIRGPKWRNVKHTPGISGFHIFLNGLHWTPNTTHTANVKVNKNQIIAHKMILILGCVPRMMRWINKQIETLMQRVAMTLSSSSNTSYIPASKSVDWINSTCRPNPYLTRWTSKIEQQIVMGCYEVNDMTLRRLMWRMSPLTNAK